MLDNKLWAYRVHASSYKFSIFIASLEAIFRFVLQQLKLKKIDIFTEKQTITH